MTRVKLGGLELEVTEIDEQVLETGRRRVKLTGEIPLKQQNKLLNQLMKKPLSLRIGNREEMEMATKNYTHAEKEESLSFEISLESYDDEKDLDTTTLLAIDAVFSRIRIRALLDLLEEKGVINSEEYENRFESIAHRDAESVIGSVFLFGVKEKTKHKHAHAHD